MNDFLQQWGQAAYTTLGFFWMALWAFVLGYLLSSMIQVFVTEKRMQQAMGGSESRQVALGTFFGFISSSCSFAALASAKSLFQKGASFLATIAFLLASTNLVIELGIVISIFLGWQFVVGEYVGGLILIGVSWVLIKLINPKELIKNAKNKLSNEEEEGHTAQQGSWRDKLTSPENWAKVSKQYAMEWKMVWKDVTIGFTVAGIVAAFVPDSFFQSLFWNSGPGQTQFSFLEVMQHIIVGPVAAFLTFIGSMGNIPLAALLFSKGVSFAGVMAFIFSDLVVFPVLRINAKYYGWRMSFFILFLLFCALVVSALSLHYGFDVLGILPDPSQVKISSATYFEMDYSFWLNLLGLALSSGMLWWGMVKYKDLSYHKEMAPKNPTLEQVLRYLAYICYAWLVIGISLYLFA